MESHDDSKELEPCDLYIGALVKIFSHQFLVHGADAYTLKYMEANHNHWRYSDLSAIVEKVKGKAEVLKRIILTYPSLATRSIDLNEIDIIFKKSGISLVKQEVVTIFRGLDPLHTGSAKMSKLLKFVMDMM